MPKSPPKLPLSTAKMTREFREARDVQVLMPTVFLSWKKAGISKKKARKIPLLTDAEKQNLFSFCQPWLVDIFFAKVSIPDESYFQLYRNRILHWSKSQKPVKPAPKFSPKIMVCGALSYRGFLKKKFCDRGAINCQRYIDIINNFSPYDGFPVGWILRQDGLSWNRSGKLHSNIREI